MDSKFIGLGNINKARNHKSSEETMNNKTLWSIMNGRTITNVYEQPSGACLIRLSGRMELYVAKGHLIDGDDVLGISDVSDTADKQKGIDQ